MAEIIERTKFTVPVLAKMWGVSSSKITTFIRTGELRAINSATKLGGRPRYLIDQDDIEAFERSREVVPSAEPSTRTSAEPSTRRLRKSASDVTEYF